MTEPKRTAAATAANRRRAQDRKADDLRKAGWLCTPPEDVAAARRLALKASN